MGTWTSTDCSIELMARSSGGWHCRSPIRGTRLPDERNAAWRLPMTKFDVPELSIGDVAARTGISPPTLRVWEQRYGFPVPWRSDGTHRRYSDEDCRVLCEVLRQRARGLPIAAAIERARRAVVDAQGSLFAGLRLRHPELDVVVLPEPFMLAISAALEDTTAGRDGAICVGAFQRRR